MNLVITTPCHNCYTVMREDQTNGSGQRNPAAPIRVAAVIVTRNRIDLLRRTLESFKQSTYPICEFIVSDDSSNQDTASMLAAEFPEVTRVEGPRRGISANRNKGMSFVKSDYVLLSDDDMLLDPRFIELSVEEIQRSAPGMIFTGIRDLEVIVVPNTISFLGFSSKPYKPGAAYNTANQQCFLISTRLAWEVPYDEVIEAYGYEEVDFAYRIAASGARIHCIESCCNLHLAPNASPVFRPEQDACRMYVACKRFAYVDKHPLQALLFVAVAVPHHLFHSYKRAGLRGVREAMVNFREAYRMLQKYRRSRDKRVSYLQANA